MAIFWGSVMAIFIPFVLSFFCCWFFFLARLLFLQLSIAFEICHCLSRSGNFSQCIQTSTEAPHLDITFTYQTGDINGNIPCQFEAMLRIQLVNSLGS